MQTVDSVYSEIRCGKEYWYEPRILIKNDSGDSTWLYYQNEQILSLNTSSSLFGDTYPTVGNCVSGEINLEILNYKTDHYNKNALIPRAAEIRVYFKICNSEKQSEWIREGTYFIDTREISRHDGVENITIHGFDAMLRGETGYPSTSDVNYPLLDITMLSKIANAMNVQIDSRTTALMNRRYMFPLPVSYSCREVLSKIGASYGGNFIISPAGKLRLVPIQTSQPDWLGDSDGDTILIGGARIIV